MTRIPSSDAGTTPSRQPGHRCLPMNIATLPGNSLFYTNLYVLFIPGETACLVVDPGELQPGTAQFLEQNGLIPAAYLLTHPHIDHVAGLHEFQERWPAPVWLHPEGLPLYRGVGQQAAMFGLDNPVLPEIDQWFAPPQHLEFGPLAVDIRHTPGHSPGCVSILFQEEDSEPDVPSVIVGDVLFAGSIGRTDLPGGSMSTLLRSIESELLCLPDTTKVYSGHGTPTTIGRERRSNPFLQELSS